MKLASEKVTKAHVNLRVINIISFCLLKLPAFLAFQVCACMCMHMHKYIHKYTCINIYGHRLQPSLDWNTLNLISAAYFMSLGLMTSTTWRETEGRKERCLYNSHLYAWDKGGVITLLTGSYLLICRLYQCWLVCPQAKDLLFSSRDSWTWNTSRTKHTLWLDKMDKLNFVTVLDKLESWVKWAAKIWLHHR